MVGSVGSVGFRTGYQALPSSWFTFFSNLINQAFPYLSTVAA